MSKYIDADKLTKAIEEKGLDCCFAVKMERLDTLALIDKLQQEQPEVDLEKEIDSLWNPRFNLGWDEKSLISVNRAGFENIARHFYELGLKARKK